MTNPPAGMSPRRATAERDRIHMHIMSILTPSVRKFVRRKNMGATDRLDIDQHVSIAITRAVETWDPNKASFSTHVHYKIMAELQDLQWKEYPDRRRLVIKQPIRIVEIDRPLRRMDDDSCDMTILDTLSDHEDEARAEEGAAIYMGHHRFEKVLSHYVMRQLHAKKAMGDDALAIKARHKMLRDYDIYRTRVLLMSTFERLSADNKVTRERIRQIVNKVNDGIKGQLPCIKKADDSTSEDLIIEATRPIPEDVHPEWEMVLARHLAETGEDVSVTAIAVTRTKEEMPDVHDTVITEIVPDTIVESVPDQVVVEMGAARFHSPRDAAVMQMDDENGTVLFGNVVPFRKRAFRMTSVVVAAASMASGAMASAQSRAVPPDTNMVVAESDVIHTATAQANHVGQTNSRNVKHPAIQSAAARRDENLIDIARAPSGGWGVTLARYASVDALRKAVPGERRGWSWLKGLDAGYRSEGAGAYRLAFGPLTRGQAEGMCHEARRAQRACDAVQYGGAT